MCDHRASALQLRPESHLLQKNRNRFMMAVTTARRKRQPSPIWGWADSRQNTSSTLETGSDRSLPFNLTGRGRKSHYREQAPTAVFNQGRENNQTADAAAPRKCPHTQAEPPATRFWGWLLSQGWMWLQEGSEAAAPPGTLSVPAQPL